MERVIREAGARQRWTSEQSHALLGLLIRHVGYLHLHGHALAMAQHVFRQACLKVNPSSAAAFFAEVLNNGGSICTDSGRPSRRRVASACCSSPRASTRAATGSPQNRPVAKIRGTVGAIRVPLTAVHGMGPEAAARPGRARCLRRLPACWTSAAKSTAGLSPVATCSCSSSSGRSPSPDHVAR